MSLQRRIILSVTALVLVAVIPLTLLSAITVRQSLLDQRERDGILLADLVAQSASFIQEIPSDVETVLEEQMIVQARVAAYMVAYAEQAGLMPDQINTALRRIVDTSVIDEFWITDDSGEAYLRSDEFFEFTFSPSAEEQPQAYIFWPLLDGETDVVVQEARTREVDDQRFKYVGVSGVDQPRIVQVGYNASILDEIEERLGLPRLIERIFSSDLDFAPISS